MGKISIWDILFPPKCIICGCRLNLNKNEFCICNSCEMNLSKYVIKYDDYVPNYLNNVNKFYCMFRYKEEIREAFLDYKFKGEIWKGKFFGKILNEYLLRNNAYLDIDNICVIPVNDKNLAKRGYDQTREIAIQISRLSNIPILDCLKKDNLIKDNAAQNKSRVERLYERKYFIKNNKEMIKGKNFLLLDDILTTGGTINECAKLLKENGAENIVCAVFATGRRDL